MKIISCLRGDRIAIGDSIVLVVISHGERHVRIGIEAPQSERIRTPKATLAVATAMVLLLLLAGCTSAPVARRTQLPTPAVRKTALPPLPPITTNSVKRQAMLRRAPAVVAVSGGITAVVPPVECASHGSAYFTTNYIPHEVRFLAADYNLKAGKTYQFEVSETLKSWHSVVDPYFAPADEVYTRSINFYVNGYYYPRQFARMRIVP